ncbi:MAG: hypothetical protein H0T51_12600 [Pirellulales bacterium]|nr:hypothetical protein [Pirellulales bacterium]
MAYRLITALRIEIEPPAGVSSQEIIANLDSDGCNLLKSGVRPRAPKARIVDVRPSDYVLLNGMWRKVVGLVMHSERMLTDEQAAEHEGHGWLVKAPEGYVSPITGGALGESRQFPGLINRRFRRLELVGLAAHHNPRAPLAFDVVALGLRGRGCRQPSI